MELLSRERIEGLGSPLARRVEYHGEIGSTQERARELARAGAPHGTLVVSGTQTGGQGRLGRRWDSPQGGLWMSVVLRPPVPLRFAARITQAASVAVAKTLRRYGVGARIKWPNDLLVGEHKVCGILAESVAGRGRAPNFIVLGVGLNANLNPEDLGRAEHEATTIRSELGRDVNLLELIGALLHSLDAELERLEDFGAILDDWRTLSCTLGRRVRVQTSGNIVQGKALDLSPEGALILDTPDGVVELFEGEVKHLRL